MSSIFGIIKAAMCTSLPGQAGYLNSFLFSATFQPYLEARDWVTIQKETP